VKWLGLIVLVAGLGLAGFPPCGTYLGKALMEESAAHFGQEWLSWVFTIVSAVTGAAVLRVAASVFLGWGSDPGAEAASPTEAETRETKGGARMPAVMVTMAALLALLPAISGLVPGLGAAGQAAAERFVDSTGYGSRVLDARFLGPVVATEPAHSTRKGVSFGFGAALGAIALAALALSRDRWPKPLQQPFGRPGILLLKGLRVVHSGDIRDYVAWLSFGLCGMAGVLAFIWRA
jgi:multicomponent Na+:H+ antiporter subunit D